MTTLQEKIAALRRKLDAYRTLQELGEDHAAEIETLEAELQALVQTGGGAYVGGDVNTGGGEFVGRDKKVSGGERSVVIGGSVSGSTIITGDHNTVAQPTNLFAPVYEAIQRSPRSAQDKEDLTAEVREIEAAAQALGELGNLPLSRLLSSDFTPEEIGIERAVQPLIAALTDEDLGVRCAVIEALARIRDEGTTEPLIGLLTDENEEVRCAAIRALGWMGDAQAVQPLRAVLGQHPYVVANALSRFGAAAIELLVSALGEANPDVRRAAAWALGKIGDLTAVQPLVAMLRHEDRETAFSAAEALREMVILNVKPFIEARDSPTAAREIEERFGSPEMVNLLLSMLVSYTGRVQVLGGQITDPVSLAWVGDAYRAPDRALHGAVSAAHVLGAIREERAVRPLLEALEDRDTDLRRAAL